jgi:hypothetical protein
VQNAPIRHLISVQSGTAERCNPAPDHGGLRRWNSADHVKLGPVVEAVSLHGLLTWTGQRSGRSVAPMPLLYDAQYWRDRAEEARTIAATMVTAEGRQTMLEIAKLHDRMAASAERIRASDREPHPTGGDGKGHF